jgi:hypothetical protein
MAQMCHSRKPCCTNDQHYPIRSQWDIAEVGMLKEFRHGERSNLGSHPSTIRLTGIAYLTGATGAMQGRQWEGNSSSRRT